MYNQNYLLICMHFHASVLYNLSCVQLNVIKYVYNLDGGLSCPLPSAGWLNIVKTKSIGETKKCSLQKMFFPKGTAISISCLKHIVYKYTCSVIKNDSL